MPVPIAGGGAVPPDEPAAASAPPEPPLLLEEPLGPPPEELPEPAPPDPDADPEDPVDTIPELDAVPPEGAPLELPVVSPELEGVPPELCVAEPDEPSPVPPAPLSGVVVDAFPEHAIGPTSVNNGSNERRCRLMAMAVLALWCTAPQVPRRAQCLISTLEVDGKRPMVFFGTMPAPEPTYCSWTGFKRPH